MMRYVLVVLAVAGLLVLAGCSGLFPIAKTPVEIGQELVDKLVEILNDPDFVFPDPDSSPTKFMEFALDFIYVPPGDDRKDSNVIIGTSEVIFLVGLNFTYPATITDVKVLAASEHDVKFLPHNILNDPPDFVDKVYTLTLQCETEDGTITSVTLPMITVTGETQGYFYTVFVKETDTGTATWMYPVMPIS